MSTYIASVGVYCYAKDEVIVESFKTEHDNWKKALLLHSEFAEEVSSGGNLDWLSADHKTAIKQLDENDLQVDIVFIQINQTPKIQGE